MKCLFVDCEMRYRPKTKVIIRPDFFGTASNFDGVSRENYEVIRDAELSRIPNPILILSGFECNVASHVAVDHFDGLITKLYLIRCRRMRSFELKMHQIDFRPGLCPEPRWGSLRRFPRPSSRLGGQDTPYLSPSTHLLPRTMP